MYARVLLVRLQVHFAERLLNVNVTEDDMFRNVTFAVDTTTCRLVKSGGAAIEELTFSGEKGYNGLKYQILVSTGTCKIIHIFGPIPATYNDHNILEMSGVMGLRLPNELGIADGAYNKLSARLLLTPFAKFRGGLTLRRRVWNNLISSVRIDIERVFQRIKRFAILSATSRLHDLHKHGTIFFVICNLVNIDITMHPMRRVSAAVLQHCPMEVVRQLDDTVYYSRQPARNVWRNQVRQDYLARLLE